MLGLRLSKNRNLTDVTVVATGMSYHNQ